MKKSNYFRCGLFILALSFTLFSGCGTSGSGASSTTAVSSVATGDSGQLVIQRAANMGSTVFLNVSIDGKHVGDVSPGQSYKGALSPGAHVVSVLLQPNGLNLPPTTKRITVEKGQTYTYTAMWEGERVVLL